MHIAHYLDLFIGGHYEGDQQWSSKVLPERDNCFKLYYPLYGDIVIESPDSEIHLYPNQLYLINGYTISGYRSEGTFGVEWLHFRPCSIELSSMIRQLDFVTPLPDHPEIVKLMQTYFNATDNPSPNQYVMLESLIVYQLYRLIEQNAITPLFEQMYFLPLLEYIDTHQNKNIALAEMGEVMFTSPNHLHRKFKAAFGISPAQYVTQSKMQKALKLILTTYKSNAEIAFELGYCDEGHFCRTFKKSYNHTPKEIRKQKNSCFWETKRSVK